MTDLEELAFIKRLLGLLAKYDDRDLLWAVGDDGQLHFSVDCSDLFRWATADAEEVTPGNIHVLERAYEDCEKVWPGIGTAYAQSLFACRMQGMRPQQATYLILDLSLHPLFDACGPERTKEDEG